MTVTRIISCVDRYLDTLQDLGFLFVTPQKVEMMIASNDRSLAVQDILVRVRSVVIVECLWSAGNSRGITGSRWGVSLDELDMGYWIKVAVKWSF